MRSCRRPSVGCPGSPKDGPAGVDGLTRRAVQGTSTELGRRVGPRRSRLPLGTECTKVALERGALAASAPATSHATTIGRNAMAH